MAWKVTTIQEGTLWSKCLQSFVEKFKSNALRKDNLDTIKKPTEYCQSMQKGFYFTPHHPAISMVFLLTDYSSKGHSTTFH